MNYYIFKQTPVDNSLQNPKLYQNFFLMTALTGQLMDMFHRSHITLRVSACMHATVALTSHTGSADTFRSPDLCFTHMLNSSKFRPLWIMQL